MSDKISNNLTLPDSEVTTLADPDNAPGTVHQTPESGINISEIGGETVRLDNIVGGDQVEPDKNIIGDVVSGDKIGRDKITLGDLEDAAVAAGERSAVATKGGIAISGDVGGDLLISIGNTRIHLHPLVQSALVLITIGVVFLVTVQIYNVYKNQRKPKVMDGPFNVAMAELKVVDQDGKPIESKISDELYDLLKNSFESNDDEAPSYELWPPKYTGQIEGDTKEERKEAVEAKASEIRADIILYGVITQTDSLLEFTPEFYVSLDSFKDAEEIVGQHRLGEPLKFESGNEMRFYPPLKRRLEALSQVTIGLAYFKFGGFEDALNIFSDVNLKDHEGKEVVELLLANTNLLLASETKPDEYLIAASVHYDNALTINPSYARAKVGQAIVLRSMALGDLADPHFDRKIDEKLLDDAESAFKAALNLGVQHENANIEAKVHLGLGTIYRARAIALGQDVDSLEPAKAEFIQVVEEYENGNKRIENLAGNAYEELGWIAAVQGKLDDAIGYYDNATKLVEDRSRSRPFYRLGETYLQTGRTELALESFTQCIDFSGRFDNDEYLKKCTEAKNQPNNVVTSLQPDPTR
jgi:tetratricopeptide (TPR) repeat protein